MGRPDGNHVHLRHLYSYHLVSLEIKEKYPGHCLFFCEVHSPLGTACHVSWRSEGVFSQAESSAVLRLCLPSESP